MARLTNLTVRQARADNILAAARAHLAQEGIAGFSLRAVARRLDLAPNSLYNYFPSLDDLITALLVDAFKRLAAAVGAADQGLTWHDRFTAVCMAYRAWAVANRTDYDLIFGSPIPGYHAPGDLTGPLAMQSFAAGLRVLVGAWRAGALTLPPHYQAIPPSVAVSLARHNIAEDADVPLALSYLMFVTWVRMHGMIMLENHGHDDDVLGDPAAFFSHNISCLIAEIGFHPT